MRSAAALLAVLAAPLDLGAEVICDPENPAGCPAQGAPRLEIVCDPENPVGCAPEPPAESAIVCDPENPAGCEGGRARQSEAFSPIAPQWVGLVRAEAGAWGAVDTRWSESEDVFEWGAGADLSVGARRGAKWSVLASGALRSWYGMPRSGADQGAALLEVRLDESFIQRRWSRFSVRAGALTFPWSVMLIERPAAAINRQDRRALSRVGPGRTDRDLVQPALELSWSDGSSFAELALIPFFVPDEVTFVGRDAGIVPLRLGAGVRAQAGALESINDALARAGAPDEVWSAASVGGRAGATLAGVDLSAGAYFGWDRTPLVRLDDELAALIEAGLDRGGVAAPLDLIELVAERPDLAARLAEIVSRGAAGAPLIGVSPKRRLEGFVTAETYLGAWGVRAEASATPAASALTESLEGVRRPRAAWSAGLSREGGAGWGDWFGALESFGTHFARAEASATRLFVPADERGAGAEIALTGRHLVGVGIVGFARLRAPALEFGGALRAHATSGELFSEMYVSAPIGAGSSARAWLGASWASGPPLEERWTLGGVYDPNDAVFAGVAHAF